ncbi:MAG: MoxR family ATPase [Candidatus Pacearchaeota archaeon]
MIREKEVEIEEIPLILERIEEEVGKVVIGQKDIIRDIFVSILCEGHVLVEGVPGIAKTLIIESLARVLGCHSKRIQFTVDLLPTDITGITVFNEKIKDFEVIKGPIFTNLLIADEINRSPPKTQSALLEAMQERKVSIGRVDYSLPRPFFVMATQNPIEQSGVYPLPEAQIDRFLFKLLINYPKREEEEMILENNVTIRNLSDYNLQSVLTPSVILSLQQKVKEVYCSPHVKKYIVELVSLTRDKYFPYSKYILVGASPRASISLFIASKAVALINGRNFVIPEDVKKVIHNVLRHRIILSFEAEADKINTDFIIDYLLKTVGAP